MTQNRGNAPALESFWQQADADASDEHPLEREIADLVDALSRYSELIDAAQAEGRDDLADILLEQQARQEEVVHLLWCALRRMQKEAE
jgi:hypothetical protein